MQSAVHVRRGGLRARHLGKLVLAVALLVAMTSCDAARSPMNPHGSTEGGSEAAALRASIASSPVLHLRPTSRCSVPPKTARASWRPTGSGAPSMFGKMAVSRRRLS